MTLRIWLTRFQRSEHQPILIAVPDTDIQSTHVYATKKLFPPRNGGHEVLRQAGKLGVVTVFESLQHEQIR